MFAAWTRSSRRENIRADRRLFGTGSRSNRLYTQIGSDGVEKVRARARITAKGLARLATEFNAVPSN
jgi:hypothetical protein